MTEQQRAILDSFKIGGPPLPSRPPHAKEIRRYQRALFVYAMPDGALLAYDTLEPVNITPADGWEFVKAVPCNR